MARTKRGGEKQHGSSGEDGENPVDAVDQINQDIGLLREMLKLMRVASMKGGEEWWEVSLAYATDEMLVRLERIGNFCNRFLKPGGNEKGRD